MKTFLLLVLQLTFVSALSAANLEDIIISDIQIVNQDTNVPPAPKPEETSVNKSIGLVTGHAVGNTVHLTIDLTARTIKGRSAGKVIHLSIDETASKITGRADGEVVSLNIDRVAGEIMGRAGDERVHLHMDKVA